MAHKKPYNPRYITTDIQLVVCEHCGNIQKSQQIVDKLSGVAHMRCKKCGKDGEPIPYTDGK